MANIARLLLYVGVLFAIGDVFARWARGDTWAARVPADAQRGPVLAWLAIMTAAVVLFIVQFFALELAPTVTDVGLLVRETTWGRGWMLLAACSLAGMFVTIVRAPLLARAAVALFLAAAMGGLGHAAADEAYPLLSRGLDALHVLGIGAWLGTLACLALVPSASASLESWTRLSAVAIVAAPLTVLTGLGSALRRVSSASPSEVIVSDYGRLLAGKIAIVALILWLGNRHRRQLRARDLPTLSSVRLELVLACVALAVTAVLTGTSPPGD